MLLGYRRESANRLRDRTALPFAFKPLLASIPFPGLPPAEQARKPSITALSLPPRKLVSCRKCAITPSRPLHHHNPTRSPSSPLHPPAPSRALDDCRALLLAGLQLLVDEEEDEGDGDDKDDAEDDHDTGVLAGPVAALGDLGEGVASDDGEVDGRHFGGGVENTTKNQIC